MACQSVNVRRMNRSSYSWALLEKQACWTERLVLLSSLSSVPSVFEGKDQPYYLTRSVCNALSVSVVWIEVRYSHVIVV